jgi:chemotaxis methyl-accepting protein methylase
MESRGEQRQIRIWCAAAATGQEPYSLTMILDEEMKKLAGWNIEILATDLSSAAIATAREGRYTQFEVQRGLPISHLLRYFMNEGERWRINEYLRAKVQFQEFNLLSDFRHLGQFDVIFCRNVLIYFDIETKKDVLRRLSGALAKDGFLINAHAASKPPLSQYPSAVTASANTSRAPAGRASSATQVFASGECGFLRACSARFLNRERNLIAWVSPPSGKALERNEQKCERFAIAIKFTQIAQAYL